MIGPSFSFENTYAAELEGFSVPAEAARFPAPRVLELNAPLARELGLDPDALRTDAGAALLCGNAVAAGSKPVAQVYAGHQFGGFSPQLGDGRALLLGELVDGRGCRRDLQLKGSGPTPFSRGGDGKATLSSVLREYLISEAMHALGVATTRSLSVVETGESIYREDERPGAVLARVAASHIRVGTFEYFAARRMHGRVQQLVDYTLRRHYPEQADAERPAFALLVAVAQAQARLVARWMLVGFIHGVMNTDNMTVSGETIDYGPCAFMDTYDPATVFSSIDTRGRYAYGNQPGIAAWNLARLAEALLPLLGDEDAQQGIERFKQTYVEAWTQGMRDKLGLLGEGPSDHGLAEQLLQLAHTHGADYTSLFRDLADAAAGNPAPVRTRLGEGEDAERWLGAWGQRRAQDPRDPMEVAAAMNRVNPRYVPRNHRVEDALRAGQDEGDLEPFRTLLEALRNPFASREDWVRFASPAPPSFYPYRTFCGT